MEEDSAAAAILGGIQVGDVITAIDDKPIRSATDLAAEMSNRSGTSVRVRYMIRGEWQSEKVISLR